MKILLVSISAPPKNSAESIQTGRYLKHLNEQHEVILLTTKAVGGWEPADVSLERYLQRLGQKIELSNLHPKAVSALKRFFPRLLTPDENFFFSMQDRKAIGRIGDKPDLIISRSLPFSSALLAMKLAHHWRVPWIMHLSDLWTDSPFLNLDEKARIRHSALERQCFETADIITLTSKQVIRFFQNKYPALSRKFQFLPNVFDDDNINKEPVSFTGKLRMVFTGRLYGTRSVSSLMMLLENTFKVYPEIKHHLEISIAGFIEQQNINLIQRSDLGIIKYLGALSLEQALELQRAAHMLILIDSWDADDRYNMFFPSKLLDYIAARRTIVALTRKDSTTFEVVEGKFGKCFFSENLGKFPEFMNQALTAFKNNQTQYFQPAADESASEYSASFNAARLNDMIKEIFERG
jgi:glycosyltransferase involved in cell wall biosynthesis